MAQKANTATAKEAANKNSSLFEASSKVVGGIAYRVSHSRRYLIALVLVALVLFGALFDGIANFNRAYGGVRVGGVDVGGMNADEIRQAVGQEYAGRLSAAGVTIYTGRDTLSDRISVDEYGNEISREEERRMKGVWSTNAESLQAYIDYDSMVEQALSVGRGGPFARFDALLGDHEISIPVNFNEAIVEALAQDIDQTVGTPLVNYGVEVSSGTATVTTGSDGNMVDRDQLKTNLANVLLSPETDNRNFTIEPVQTPVHVGLEEAQIMADAINRALSDGVLFRSDTSSWIADAYTLGEWVDVAVERTEDEAYHLVAKLDLTPLRTAVLEHIQPAYTSGKGDVRFTKSDGQVRVSVTSTGTFPQIGDALSNLNDTLFSQYETYAHDPATGAAIVDIESSAIPESMTLDEALSIGVVTGFSAYTTEYTSGALERNTNIHLAADLINDSIVAADGGVWSFNETAGECNEEKGFMPAAAITGGELVDEIGGGICQVATTVFNAVYEAGLPITERLNHALYIASYPQGRDASISWPSPDLKWQNDTSSDILLRMTYTDSSVTATLYGVDMDYTVESEEGEWEEGQKSQTVYKYDEDLYPGAEYVKTEGSDGHSITVTRTVTDASGAPVRTDVFSSVYSAEDTVIMRGPGAGESYTLDTAEDTVESTGYDDEINELSDAA